MSQYGMQMPGGQLPPFLNGARRAVDYASSFATELGRDNNETTKPTATHAVERDRAFFPPPPA